MTSRLETCSVDPEVITDTKQVFDGRAYYLCGRYFQHTVILRVVNGKRKATSRLLHRDVWEYTHGKIAKGMEIHHKDGDPANNRLENLDLIKAFDHRSLHASEPEAVERARKWVDHIRPLTKRWHRSREGRAWHRQHAKRVFGDRPYLDYECHFCGKSFKSRDHRKKPRRFCSQWCRNHFHLRRRREEKNTRASLTSMTSRCRESDASRSKAA